MSSCTSWWKLIFIFSLRSHTRLVLPMSLNLLVTVIRSSTPCSSHNRVDINWAMCVAHSITFSSIHNVTVLRLLICNYSTNSSNCIAGTSQLYHLNWISQWFNSSIIIGSVPLGIRRLLKLSRWLQLIICCIIIYRFRLKILHLSFIYKLAYLN